MSREMIAIIMIVIGAILAATGILINKKGISIPGTGKEYMKVKAFLNIFIGVVSIILGAIFLVINVEVIFVQIAIFVVLILIVLLDFLLKKTVK
ncbi:hypothetical protein [Clostridium cellulovorans]|uniref:DUF3784 domain-containing protein n=1 Tax=Clostridium cellulovorans (strain ATCC 35296 / DSM 3052 / OCM 3 / 743B) TaxID=573061 RepID=D9SMS5_CLOC7|nr:hypothetical protein [Clostridium cellulovorans]ADL49860.1 hypothetical protein Clocel_0071 [Clostridium cellulovorans 743B]